MAPPLASTMVARQRAVAATRGSVRLATAPGQVYQTDGSTVCRLSGAHRGGSVHRAVVGVRLRQRAVCASAADLLCAAVALHPRGVVPPIDGAIRVSSGRHGGG